METGERFLSTNRLVFSHWSPKDYRNALKLWGNPKVIRFIARIISTNRKVKSLLSAEIRYEKDHGIQYWPIYSNANNEFIGCCGLKIYGDEDSFYELGCHICEDFWNLGYAQEASVEVIKYAFEKLGAKAIFARHNPNNIASKVVLLKIGFKSTGKGYL